MTDDCENCQRLGSIYCKNCRPTQGVLHSHGSNFVRKHPVDNVKRGRSPFPGTDIGVVDRGRR